MAEKRNALYYGDCLRILKGHIAPESVDLVYLDPPFNSNRDNDIHWGEQSGAPTENAPSLSRHQRGEV